MNPIEKWLEATGKTMLQSIGIQPHHNVLDFGCGEGMYTLVCSQLLAEKGRLHALDKNTTQLNELSKKIQKVNLLNITLHETHDDSNLPIETNTIDFILLFDVFHLISNRAVLLNEFKRILKTTGTLSIYPKHHDTELHMSIDDIHNELNTNGFELSQQHTLTLLHNKQLELATVYNYQKKS